MGSVSYGLGADLSLPPCLSVTPRQRYCCLGLLFAHAQAHSNSSSYHIRENEMNCVGSSEYMTVFTSITRASFHNTPADQSSSWLIRTSFPKSTIL